MMQAMMMGIMGLQDGDGMQCGSRQGRPSPFIVGCAA